MVVIIKVCDALKKKSKDAISDFTGYLYRLWSFNHRSVIHKKFSNSCEIKRQLSRFREFTMPSKYVAIRYRHVKVTIVCPYHWNSFMKANLWGDFDILLNMPVNYRIATFFKLWLAHLWYYGLQAYPEVSRFFLAVQHFLMA